LKKAITNYGHFLQEPNQIHYDDGSITTDLVIIFDDESITMKKEELNEEDNKRILR
jgi:hypothetical protein